MPILLSKASAMQRPARPEPEIILKAPPDTRHFSYALPMGKLTESLHEEILYYRSRFTDASVTSRQTEAERAFAAAAASKSAPPLHVARR